MARTTVTQARSFVADLELPPPRRSRDIQATADAVDLAFDKAKTQATVVGSDVISFVAGVTPERRQDIVNSSLLAQMVAKKRVPDPNDVYGWYDAYFEVLTNIGWVVQDRGFSEYQQSSDDFTANQAILQVATTLLGAAPAALAVIKSTLDAMKSMDDGSPWITVFNRESQSARAARFQIGLAEQSPDGQFFVTLMAFGLEANSTLTQVLFVKFKSRDTTLKYYSGKVTIDTDVLEGVRDPIKAKLAGLAADYVKGLPDFN